jgi:hypothetical protein
VKWVWSTEPAHEPLIPKWMYDELAARRQARRGSRDGSSPNTHPATRRTYVLRGMVFCGCGRRMFGTHHHGITYYLCWPRSNNRGRPNEHAGQRKAVYLREDAILEAITRFFADQVFGPHRRDILTADLDSIDNRTERERRFERERLQRVVADLTRRQSSVLRQAQNGDRDDPFARALRSTYNDLDAEKNAALSIIAQLDATEEAGPSHPGTALLDALPYLTRNLTTAPEPLVRRLFEITQVAVRLRDNSDYVTITITLPAD